MNASDRQTFVEIVLGFAELKGKEVSAAALEFYWRALRYWPLEDFRAAAEHLARTSEFFPGPDAFEKLRKAARPTAGEAWARAQDAAGSAIQCGHVTSGGTCGDQFIDSVVRAIGGYGVIAMCETAKIGFLERRFAEHYETMSDAAETRAAVPQIAHDAERLLIAARARAKALLR